MEKQNSYVKDQYFQIYNSKCDHVISSGGRFEILGNHTDHNHGKCIAATVNLCITAGVSNNSSNVIKFASEEFGIFDLSLNDLEPDSKNNPTKEIIKGVAKYFKLQGYKIGGFNIYNTSNIFPGAGVSSSAAFLLLIAQIFNQLFNEGKVTQLEMCKAGQYSENNYYGKKSGLLDEIGACYGNLVSIDFKDIDSPKIENMKFPFDDIHFVIVNTGGSHAGLNDLYSSIPNDMYHAANKLGQNFLRDCDFDKISANPALFTENELSRARHFFNENLRVERAIVSIKNNIRSEFLNLINESRISSTKLLKNMMVGDDYESSPLQACDRAMEIIGDDGACKINGGGFAGSIICFVPANKINQFITTMSNFYGKNNVREVFIRKNGPIIEE